MRVAATPSTKSIRQYKCIVSQTRVKIQFLQAIDTLVQRNINVLKTARGCFEVIIYVLESLDVAVKLFAHLLKHINSFKKLQEAGVNPLLTVCMLHEVFV